MVFAMHSIAFKASKHVMQQANFTSIFQVILSTVTSAAADIVLLIQKNGKQKIFLSRIYCCTGNMQNVITPEIHINFLLLLNSHADFVINHNGIFFLLLFENLNIGFCTKLH